MNTWEDYSAVDNTWSDMVTGLIPDNLVQIQTADKNITIIHK